MQYPYQLASLSQLFIKAGVEHLLIDDSDLVLIEFKLFFLLILCSRTKKNHLQNLALTTRIHWTKVCRNYFCCCFIVFWHIYEGSILGEELCEDLASKTTYNKEQNLDVREDKVTMDEKVEELTKWEYKMDADTEGDNGEMVEEPQKVVLEPIKYAKVANKVNIKDLKAVMWEELQTLLVLEEEREADFDMLLEKIGPKAKAKDIGDFSTSLLFICALHLCNEKGLYLSQRNIDHLVIKQSL